ncbi:hypothetical protein Tco_0875198 [Tanacetum coccineum]|uniref:Uncharacterized protein n=1 Tax=Tanacetum coccineum TaxID=301880 RepID=A0ABQ5BRL2_9ASTR
MVEVVARAYANGNWPGQPVLLPPRRIAHKDVTSFLAHITVKETGDQTEKEATSFATCTLSIGPIRNERSGGSKYKSFPTKALQRLVRHLWGAPVLFLECSSDDLEALICYGIQVYGDSLIIRVYRHILNQKELNMIQRRWLELERREPPLRVSAFSMTIGLDPSKQILNAQTDARKKRTIIE